MAHVLRPIRTLATNATGLESPEQVLIGRAQDAFKISGLLCEALSSGQALSAGRITPSLICWNCRLTGGVLAGENWKAMVAKVWRQASRRAKAES